MFWKNKLEKS